MPWGGGYIGASGLNSNFNGDAWEFIPSAIRGLRVWDVTEDGHLVGVSFRAKWVVGENRARCLVGNQAASLDRSTPDHDLNDNCACGFHGYFTDHANTFDRDLASPPRWFPKPYRVSGVIDGYGKSIVGPLGMRCSKARIVALTVRHYGIEKFGSQALANALARYWSVPMFTDHAEMLDAFPVSAHPIGPGRSAKPETGSAA
jgi:hypothetical protein